MGSPKTLAAWALVLAASFAGAPAGAATLAIGDRVWVDYDGDGIQDEEEPGAAGVRIELRLGSGTVHDVAYSDADGNYGFQAEPATGVSFDAHGSATGLGEIAKGAPGAG